MGIDVEVDEMLFYLHVHTDIHIINPKNIPNQPNVNLLF